MISVTEQYSSSNLFYRSYKLLRYYLLFLPSLICFSTYDKVYFGTNFGNSIFSGDFTGEITLDFFGEDLIDPIGDCFYDYYGETS